MPLIGSRTCPEQISSRCRLRSRSCVGTTCGRPRDSRREAVGPAFAGSGVPVAEITILPVSNPPAEVPPVPPGRAPLLVRVVTLFVIVVPLLGLVAAPFFLWGWGFSWTDM